MPAVRQNSTTKEHLRASAAGETSAGPPERASSRFSRAKIVILAAVVLVAGTLAICHEQVTLLRDHFVPKRWGVVEEGAIYRSGQLSRNLVKKMLETHHIQRVVDLTFDD